MAKMAQVQWTDVSVNRGFSEDFPGGSDGKESTYNAGDLSLIPVLGRSPGEGNGNPLQYSCLDNSMDRGAWWATVYGVAKRQTWLSDKQRTLSEQIFTSSDILYAQFL